MKKTEDFTQLRKRILDYNTINLLQKLKII